MTEQEKEGYLLPRHKNVGWRYFPPTRRYIAVTTFMLFVTVVFLSPLAAFAILLTGVLLILPHSNKRTFVYTTLWHALINHQLKRKRGRLGNVKLSSIIYADDELETRLKTDPVEVNFLPMDNVGVEYVTEVSTPDNGRHTWYVLFDSWGETNVNDWQSHLDMAASFAQAARNVAASYGPGLQMTFFKSTVPHDPMVQRVFLKENRYEPDQTDEALEELYRDFEEANYLQEAYSVDYLMGFAINLVRPPAWSKLQPRNLRTEDIVQSPAYQLSQLLMDYLSAQGAANVRRPDPYESAILFRGMLDKQSLPRLYEYRQEDLGRLGTHGFRTLEDSMVLAERPFPADYEVVVKNDYLQVAGTSYTRTFFCADFPDRPVEPGYMQSLYNLPPEALGSIALTYRVGETKVEQKTVKDEFRKADLNRLLRQQGGRTTRARDEDFEVKVRERDAALYYSGGDVLQLHLMVSVSADSVETLDRNDDRVTKHLKAPGIPLTPLKGESAQFQGPLEMLGIASA